MATRYGLPDKSRNGAGAASPIMSDAILTPLCLPKIEHARNTFAAAIGEQNVSDRIVRHGGREIDLWKRIVGALQRLPAALELHRNGYDAERRRARRSSSKVTPWIQVHGTPSPNCSAKLADGPQSK